MKRDILNSRIFDSRIRQEDVGKKERVLGYLVAVMCPTFVIPAIDINRDSWILLMSVLAAVMFPCVLLEYYYTRERVTEESRREKRDMQETPHELASIIWKMSFHQLSAENGGGDCE